MSRTKIISNQPSWRLTSSTTEVFITEQGGQLALVTFDQKNRRIQPYSVAPWAKKITTHSDHATLTATSNKRVDVPLDAIFLES